MGLGTLVTLDRKEGSTALSSTVLTHDSVFLSLDFFGWAVDLALRYNWVEKETEVIRYLFHLCL